MNLKEQFNGIQHIGIPTNDIEATIDFYKALGFEIAFRTVNEEADEEVAFLKLNTLVVETYENKAAKMEAGAIDHMAIPSNSSGKCRGQFCTEYRNSSRFRGTALLY